VPTHRTPRSTTTRITTTLVGLVAALVLTACGGADSSGDRPGAANGGTTASSSTHNDADVAFAQQMTAHHQQAVEMAQLAATRASNAQVADLAARIEAAQGPEIQTMTGWLEAWGVDPSTPGTDHGGPGMGDMAGSMSSEDMDRLESLSGSEFDRAFLTLMTSHHQGAVDMATTEQADGTDPDAVALAGQVITDQTAQIGEMQVLLTQV